MARRQVSMPNGGRVTVPPDEDQPVFVRHPPVLTHKYHREPYYRVPYPYQFKIDKGWIFILFLAGWGLSFKPLLILAVFIAVVRCWIWLCFRFPMTMTFFNGFLSTLLGGGRRYRRW